MGKGVPTHTHTHTHMQQEQTYKYIYYITIFLIYIDKTPEMTSFAHELNLNKTSVLKYLKSNECANIL